MSDDRLSDVVKTGDRRASLIAIRDHLARELESARYVKDLPPLAKQLTDVMREIEALPVPGEVSQADEIAKKRATRRSKAAGS